MRSFTNALEKRGHVALCDLMNRLSSGSPEKGIESCLSLGTGW